MKKLLVTAVAAAVVMIGGPAWAISPPYTVTVGTTAGPATPFSATSSGAVKVNIRNGAGSVLTMTCTSVSLSGTVTIGTNINPWASVASSSWSGCTFIGGPYTVAQLSVPTVRGTTSATPPGTDVIDGFLDNFALSLGTTSSGICSFQLKGTSSTVNASIASVFNEATQVLTVAGSGFPGDLRVYGASGCLGQLQNGNPANVQGVFNVATTGGAVNLS